jgi:hypothetical protein
VTFQFLNQDQTIVGRIDDDGLMRVTGDATAWLEYLDWLNEGNTPLPAPEPPPPGPDYLAFWDALMVSTVYASIREQSFVSLPMNTLATEFIALIGDAKAGRANEAAIQASMDAILATGTFTEAQLVELQGALEAGHLDGIYTLPPPTVG